MLQHNGIFHEYKRKGEVEMQFSLSIHAIEIMISFSPSVIWSCMQTLAFKCCHEKKWKNMMSSSTTIGINQCQFHVLFFFFCFFFFSIIRGFTVPWRTSVVCLHYSRHFRKAFQTNSYQTFIIMYLLFVHINCLIHFICWKDRKK